ncbi:MAG: hypothetical protein HQL10_08655 [Nitrospirae bacterium]|nr:hypothetical protein [Nitrospirota bacterium]
MSLFRKSNLVCLKCKKCIEVTDSKIAKLQYRLAKANDFIPIRESLEIYGICRECR